MGFLLDFKKKKLEKCKKKKKKKKGDIGLNRDMNETNISIRFFQNIDRFFSLKRKRSRNKRIIKNKY